MSAGTVNVELERSQVGMGIRKISQDIAYGDFTDANGTGTLTMTDTIPAGSFVLGSKVKVTTGFGDAGVSITTCTLSIGDAGNADGYSGNTTHDIFTVADNLVLASFINSDCGIVAEGSANEILLVGTDSGGDWSEVSAGEMAVEVFYFSTNLELPVKEEA